MFISGPGQTYAVSIFVDPIIDELGWSRTTVSGLYTAGSLTAAVAMVLVGRLLDRYGARVMLMAIGVLFGLAALWMSTVKGPAQWYLGVFAIRTLGQGSLTLIPTTLVALWFVQLRGRATAITSLGIAGSQALFPPLIHILISHHGWRAAWIALAFMIWGVLPLPAALLARRTPESVGLLPDGRRIPAEEATRDEPRHRISETHWTLGEATRTRAFWLLLFASLSQPLIGTALIFHQVSLLTSKGLDAAIAAAVFSVFAPMSLLGAFAAGLLADRVPNRYLLGLGQIGLVVAMLWTFAIFIPWQAFVYGAVLGFTGGFLLTISAVIWPNYYGRLHLGSIRGVATSALVAFAALGPLPFGFLFDLTNSYTTAILLSLVLPASCAVAALLARPPQKQEASTS